MQVHGQHAVGAGGGDHVGHELGGDGVSALGLAVLTGIAEVGDDRGDAAGGGPAQGVDHNEQFHEVVVHRLTGGLDHKHILAADGLVHPDADLAVGKGGDVVVAQADAELLADSLSQLLAGIGGKDLSSTLMCDHSALLFLYSLWFTAVSHRNSLHTP